MQLQCDTDWSACLSPTKKRNKKYFAVLTRSDESLSTWIVIYVVELNGIF